MKPTRGIFPAITMPTFLITDIIIQVVMCGPFLQKVFLQELFYDIRSGNINKFRQEPWIFSKALVLASCHSGSFFLNNFPTQQIN
jgi:hypothetical protein